MIAVGLSGKKSQGAVSVAIKLGQQLRGYDPEDRQWSHAFFVLPDGDRVERDSLVVEAQKRGIRPARLSNYKLDDITVFELPMSAADELQVRAFINNALQERVKYGYATFVGLVLYCATAPLPFIPNIYIQQTGTAICSGFVSDGGTRAGYIWPKPAFAMMPADLSKARRELGLRTLEIAS